MWKTQNQFLWFSNCVLRLDLLLSTGYFQYSGRSKNLEGPVVIDGHITKKVLLLSRPKWPPWISLVLPALVYFFMQPRYSNLSSQSCYLSFQERIKTKMFLPNIFLLCIASTTIITGNWLLIVAFTKGKIFCRLFGTICFQRNKNHNSIDVSLILKHP